MGWIDLVGGGIRVQAKNLLEYICCRYGEIKCDCWAASRSEVMVKMSAAGVKPDCYAYNFLLHAHRIAGVPVNADEWLQTFKAAGVELNSVM